MNWQPGDHAIIVNATGEAECYNGVQCEILSHGEMRWSQYGEYLSWQIQPIMIEPEHQHIAAFWAHAHNLQPLDDSDEPGRWEDCVWQPKAIRNKLTLRKIEALQELKEDIQREAKP
jgi:hypothetical protein